MNTYSIGIATALLFLATTSASGFTKSKTHPSKVGVVTDVVIEAVGCHTTGDPCNNNGINAGAIISGKVKFTGYGWPKWLNYKKATITTSTSWAWDSYEGDLHPCALYNIVPIPIKQIGTGGASSFETDATIIIKVPYKGTIYGKVRGGSNCELNVDHDDPDINESVVAFEVDPDLSTGKFFGATGTGSVRAEAVQTLDGGFPFFEVYLNLQKPKRY